MPRLDVGSAFRAIRRAFDGQALSIATVALVVGAGSAVFALANATLIRPLPFPNGDRLAQIYLLPPDAPGETSANPLHPRAFVMFREQLTLTEGLAGAWSRERAIGGDIDPESLTAADVSADFFDVLGVRPALGRTFRPDEDRDGAPVVILGHALWQSRFGGEQSAIGESLIIDGQAHQVIGVMPPGLDTTFVPATFWTPLGVHRGNLQREGSTYITNVARMRPGVTVAQLDAEVAAIGPAINRESVPTFRQWQAKARTLRQAQFGAQRTGTLLLLIAVAALTLIAVTNLVHLTLTRSLSRRVETALRRALGASPGRLIRGEVAGASLVALVGGGLGLGLAQWILPTLVALDPSRSLPRDTASIDWRVVLATFGMSLAVTLAAALWPMLVEARRDPRGALVGGGGRTTGGGSRTLRLALIGVETALACVLLASSMVLFSAFNQVGRDHPGFDADRVLTAQLRPAQSRHPSVEARGALLTHVLDALRAAPGVASAATTLNEFLPGFTYVTSAAPGNPPPPDGAPQTLQFRRISDGYFETMRIPVQAGRGVLQSDTRSSMPVAVVSRLLAERFWPGTDPLGRHLQRRTPGTPVLTVVGVVADVSDVQLGRHLQPTIYIPYRQDNNSSTPMTLVVRTAGAPLDSVETVRQAVRRVDAALPLARVATLTQFLDDSLGPVRLRSTLVGLFAGLGLLLAGMGIYGVTTRTVVERTREAGIRLALGGAPRGVWWAMASPVLLAGGVGIAVGLGLALGVSRMLASSLPDLADVSTRDPIGLTAIVLATVGGLAALIPARRAARLDPITALRTESSGG